MERLKNLADLEKFSLQSLSSPPMTSRRPAAEDQ